MNNSCEPKSGGASITPSARPSIHAHRGGCAFREGERSDKLEQGSMVRYGLDEPERDCNNKNVDQGVDEVDNVFSKFARGPSPLAAKRTVMKRKSFDESTPITSEDEYSFKHSQSLPSSLLSRSYYSDDSGDFSREPINSSSFRRYENELNESLEKRCDRIGDNSANTSRNSQRAVYSDSRNVKGSPCTNSTYRHNAVNPPESNEGSHNAIVLLGAAVVVAAVVAAIYLPADSNELSSSANDQYNLKQFYRDLNYIGKKHNIGNDAILQLQTAIATIAKNQDSGSFVLAYNSNKKKFSQEEFDALINLIASTASKYLLMSLVTHESLAVYQNHTPLLLGNDSAYVHHIAVHGSKLEVRSHSELLTKYRDDVSRTGVMLVKDVDEVPSNLAMAFHYYCDEFNPVVKNSAIFFTLDMTKCSTNSVEQKPTHAQIEKCLRRKWSGVPPDNISPLLNRVVNTIVDVASD